MLYSKFLNANGLNIKPVKPVCVWEREKKKEREKEREKKREREIGKDFFLTCSFSLFNKEVKNLFD